MNEVLRGYLEKRAFLNNLKDIWYNMSPRTQNALIGSALGFIPGGFMGIHGEEDNKLNKFIISGLKGSLLGAGLGYFSPLNPQNQMIQSFKGNMSDARKKYDNPNLPLAYNINNKQDFINVNNALRNERYGSKKDFGDTIEAQKQNLYHSYKSLPERILSGYGDIF